MGVLLMRRMKDSGIEWIGKIPEDWEVIKLRYVLSLSTGLSVTKAEFVESGVPCVNYGDIHSKYTFDLDISRDKLNLVNKSHLENKATALAKKGDFIFCDTSEDIEGSGNCLFIREDDNLNIFAGSHTILGKPIQQIYSPYLGYLLKSSGIKSQIQSVVVGIKVYSITQKILKNVSLFFPTYDEQLKIASYLDKKVAQIDNIIKKTKESIEEYKKYKQSLISEVVTKGLDPSVKMKDSGIEWIGEIPEHWSLTPFKYVLKERNEKNNPVQTSERLSLSIDKGVTLYSEKTTNLDRYKEDVSKYKLAHVGDFVLNSMNMIVGAVGISDYFGCVSPAYYTYYDSVENHCTAKYCDFLFRSKTLRNVLFSLGKGIMAIDRGDGKYNTVRLKVSREDLRSLKLPIPDLIEQIEIVEFLNKKSSEIDCHIGKKERMIFELESYKKSLIYEVVTGKKEII